MYSVQGVDKFANHMHNTFESAPSLDLEKIPKALPYLKTMDLGKIPSSPPICNTLWDSEIYIVFSD